MTIKHLAYRLAHESARGISSLAQDMGKGAQVLSNKLNPNSETHHLTIAELEMLADFTNNNLAIAEYFAAKIGAVVIALPSDVPASDMSLLDAFMQSVIDGGEFAQSFNAAYADGRVTHEEFCALKAKTYHMIAAQLAFLAKIEQGVK